MAYWYVTVEGQEARPADGWDSVKQGIDKVVEGASEFVVVEPEPDSGSSFAQASVWTESVILKPSYVAEIRLPEGDSFRQWRLRTKEFGIIVRAFRDYLDGKVPEDARWEDVTDEFLDS